MITGGMAETLMDFKKNQTWKEVEE